MIDATENQDRVSIFAARTWGKIGNFAAANNIAEHIKAATSAVPTVSAFEEIWPRFAEFGAAMRTAAAHDDPEQTAQAFDAIMAEVDHHLERFERRDRAPEYVALEHDIAARLRAERPSTVIATKGAIARLLHTVRTRQGLDFHLINWVTNEGLLSIACHQSVDADSHVVPTQSARGCLVSWGALPQTVHVAGPVIRFAGEPADASPSATPERPPLCVAYFHNVNACVIEQLDAILSGSTARVIAILPPTAAAYADRFDALAAKYGTRLAVQGELGQAGFHKLLKELKETGGLFIAKTGPNTMFEAIAMNIPFLLFRSGLPQEDWVLDHIRENRLGYASPRIADISGAALTVLADPLRSGPILQQQRTYWDGLIRASTPPRAILKRLIEH